MASRFDHDAIAYLRSPLPNGEPPMTLRWTIALALGAIIVSAGPAEPRVIAPGLHHLRFGLTREWADSPQLAEGPSLSVRFNSDRNAGEWALLLRHQDVRQTWKMLPNGKELGR